MNFKHPKDTKSFFIGVIASLSAVILWDIIKYNKRLLEFKNKQ
jgi:hypothetical protein|tara:strand:- start:947 stop:1075 length:129 start_codon:yes stop_codon:yes gene_type:complete